MKIIEDIVIPFFVGFVVGFIMLNIVSVFVVNETNTKKKIEEPCFEKAEEPTPVD